MSLFDCDLVDDALQIADDLGLNSHKVGILTRVWPEKLGKDTPTDSLENFSPTPRLKELSHSFGNDLGGTQKKGELRVRMLSKEQYSEKDLDGSSDDPLIEKYYYINDELYEVVGVTEQLLYFDVNLRKAKKRKVYL